MCDLFDFSNDGEISIEEEVIGTGIVLDMLDDEDSDEDSNISDIFNDENAEVQRIIIEERKEYFDENPADGDDTQIAKYGTCKEMKIKSEGISLMDENAIKITKDRKEELLLESFELLKDEVEENKDDLYSIMGQMMEFDCPTTLKMWNHLIEQNSQNIMKDKEKYGIRDALTGTMLHELTGWDEFANMEVLFVNDKKLSNFVYSQTPDIYWGTCVIVNLIKQNNLIEANRLLELCYNNKLAQKETSFSKMLKTLIEGGLLRECPYGSSISWGYSETYNDDAKSLIQSWINRIEDKKERAKVSVAFLKML